ncbi:MAG: hypothetical protein J7K68_06465 [Candidatus Diapherotrites archaeon]|nr:hypothetical protein [Candidatus Diapherotrites archaeon]
MNNGITYVRKDTKILFDPHKSVSEGIVCISHAHSDHAVPHKTKMLMTRQTLQISGIDGEVIEYNKKVQIGDDFITSYNAGHVLGSSQFMLDSGIVYTGDIRVEDSILFPGADILHADILIIESTFGLNHFEFPKHEEVCHEIAAWAKKNMDAGRIILMGGYSFGKAQELTKILSEVCDVVLVHPKIAAINKIYEKNGVKLGKYLSFDSDEAKEIMRDNFVAIVPTHMLNRKFVDAIEAQFSYPVVTGIATGWAKMYSFRNRGVDRAFQLSDHADFNQLIEYVEQSNPREVYTVHGYAKEFARQLRRRGFKAKPLSESTQRKLTDW